MYIEEERGGREEEKGGLNGVEKEVRKVVPE